METYPCKPIENIDIISRIQIIDGTFSVDFKSVCQGS